MRRLATALPAVILLAGFAFPFYWLVAASLTPEADLFAAPGLWPRAIVLGHYRALFLEGGFWAPIRNSLVVAISTTALCLILGAPCAYALARLRFRFRRTVLVLILMVSMFPQIAIVPPLFMMLRRLGLINTYPGLVLPYLTFAMPLCIWLLHGYFRELPPELEEAALVDGAGRIRTLVSVVLPVALPGLATAAILTLVYCWNEFLFALSFTLGPERQTVPVAMALMRGQYQISWGQVLAASVVATLPVALLMLLFQRRIVRGLTAGAVKG